MDLSTREPPAASQAALPPPEQLAAIADAIDLAWYLSQCDAQTRSELEANGLPRQAAAIHYYEAGAAAGLSPIPTFSTQYYRTHNPEIEDTNPLLHYLGVGAATGLAPHPLLRPGTDLDPTKLSVVDASPEFDAKFYLEANSDVAAALFDPLLHYFLFGIREGRVPSATFDPAAYDNTAEAKPEEQDAAVAVMAADDAGVTEADAVEAAASKVEAYEATDDSVTDFGVLLLSGRAGDLSDIDDIDLVKAVAQPDWYLAQLDFPTAERLLGADDLPRAIAAHYLSEGSGLSFLPGFSAPFYADRNEDLLPDDMDPLVHFLREGAAAKLQAHPLLQGGAPVVPEGGIAAEASPLFDSKWYLAVNPDVAALKLDPLFHYLLWGSNEGRAPHPFFDGAYYRSQLPAKADPADDFCHYFTVGWHDGLSPHPVFDVEYYLEQQPEAAEAAVSPLEHYLDIGHHAGVSTHPLFDVGYYRSQLTGIARSEDPILHFLRAGRSGKLNPHPLFDTMHVQSQFATPRPESAFLTFLKAPLSIASLHPLFDVVYYLKQLQASRAGTSNPLLHYVQTANGEQASPHILFDVDHYQRQLDETERGEPALAHYLLKGWLRELSPHPLFEPQSFKNDARRGRGVAPLLDYVTNPRKTTPHFLFDEEYYRLSAGVAQSPAAAKPGLQRYLESATTQGGVATHPLFDPSYYVESVGRRLQKLQREAKVETVELLKEELSIANAQKTPLLHYALLGSKYGVSPHRSFDSDFYADQAGLDPQSDLMRHYLVDGGMRTMSPHPAIDLAFYEKSAIGFDKRVDTPFEHLIRTPKPDRTPTNRVLNSPYYLASNPDLLAYNICPIEHFATYGMSENRKPNPFFSPRHIDTAFKEELLHEQTALWEYCARATKSKALRVLFVGHDASRTGAPLILLKLIETMSANYPIEPYLLLGRDGALLPEFQAAAHCHVVPLGLDAGFLSNAVLTPEWVDGMDVVMSTFGDGPDLVICNTAETRAFAAYMTEHEIPVFSLVHEAADFFDPPQFATVYENSTRVIFPSNYTRDKAEAKSPLRNAVFSVRGQGLLDPNFGKSINRAVARKLVERELGIDERARIVVGCGTSDLRKGIDLFANVAVKALQRLDDDANRPLYFVWVGDTVTFTGPDRWARRHIEQAGFSQRVLFAGAQSDTEPFFSAADVFALTSRMDPFPCVVHEAMACGLPIVAFEGCSGAAEAFLDSGVTVQPEDPEAMVNALGAILGDDKRRSALGARARQIVDEKWSFKAYVDDLVALIESDIPVTFGLKDADTSPASDKADAKKSSISKKLDRGTVYFSSPDWGISGVNTFTEHLIVGLRERGFDARLFFSNGRFTYLPPRDRMPDLPRTFLPIQVSHHVEIWNTLTDFLAKQRPCIFVPNYDYVGSAVSPIVHPNVGVVGIAHSDDVEHYEHVDRLGRYWDRIVSVSKFIGEEIRELNPKFGSKTRNIYYGVPFDEAAARAKVDAIDLTPGKPIVLTYSGRIVTRQKNVLAFADLAERLTRAKVPFQLNLLGAGEQYDQLYSQLGGMIEAGIVRMPGRMSPKEIDAYLEESDVFVLLSDFEGLPLSMLEAMAKGVIPVVRDMKSGIPEVIDHGRDGFIAPKHDLNGMVEIIRKLQAAPAERKTIGHAVIDSFIKHGLSRDAMADAYAELFDELFAELADRPEPRAEPLAYNAPIYGIAAPPFLQVR